MVEIFIEHNGTVYIPITQEGITWSTDRMGSPGVLNFKVVKDSVIDFTEGDAVLMKVDGNNVFYGFVFKKKRNKDNIIEVTAYDQLRYLKNKDSFVYENLTVGEVIEMIAKDYNLQTGVLDDTGYKIVSRTEKEATLFDIIQTAIDMTLQNKSELYVMYDDAGKITLKNLSNMRSNLLIDVETAEDFDYESSIDSNTYNKVVLKYKNEESGVKDVYIAKDTNHINQWGVLQHYETLQKGENGQVKADALLSFYNSKTRTLSIKNALGDISIRAGSLIPVVLNLGDVEIQNYMLVEKCKHEFKDNQHTMTLNLRGGEFIA